MSTPPSLKADRVPEDDIVLVWTASRHKAALLHPTSGTLRLPLAGAFRRAGRDAAVLPPLVQGAGGGAGGPVVGWLAW